MTDWHLETFAHAMDGPVCSAVFKQELSDFQVYEELGFELEGAGEHSYLKIRKTDCNTVDVATCIARLVGVRVSDIGYSGLKDRWAVTEQWFSVYRRGKPEPDWEQLNNDNISVLDTSSHRKKLRRGVHQCNRFKLVLRGMQGSREEVEQRLLQIQNGVPNYFGEQRFGYRRGNVLRAMQLFEHNRPAQRPARKQGLYLSAARSFLFNRILSDRIAADTWQRYIPGDVFNLQGSRSVFVPEQLDEELIDRLDQGDIHITGVLWGKQKSEDGSNARTDAEAVERRVIHQYPVLAEGLVRSGMQLQRRALRVIPQSMCWQWIDSDTLELSFSLPAGSFATAVVRELIIPDQQGSRPGDNRGEKNLF